MYFEDNKTDTKSLWKNILSIFPISFSKWSICEKVQHSEFKISCMIALFVISLQIRKSPPKVKPVKCCHNTNRTLSVIEIKKWNIPNENFKSNKVSMCIVDTLLLLKFSLGIFHFFISITEQVLLVIIAKRLFKICFR